MIRTPLVTLLVACLLLPVHAILAIPGSITLAQSDQALGAVQQVSTELKASAELKEKADTGRGSDQVRVVIRTATPQPSIIQAPIIQAPIIQASGIQASILQASSIQPTITQSTTIQVPTDLAGTIESRILASGGSNIRQFQNFPLRVATMTADAAVALASRKDVAHVSLDKEVRTLGHVSHTTGTDAVRAGNGTPNNGLDGTGIGIAVLDSGVDTEHKVFLDKTNNLRVVVSRDFTGENRTDDPYGHGTHVASLAAGNGRVANSQYIGIAPNASILKLRVLNSQGVGSTSGVLSALDWVATNRAVYNIRVVNMSLGMAAVDSYRNDPVCLAVRRLVDAGIVVVAAAGNNGTDGNGNKLYGHIHSPGNEPSAITVGAANTFGTNSRDDDGIASYSSRGPTRSYWTDSSGSKHWLLQSR